MKLQDTRRPLFFHFTLDNIDTVHKVIGKLLV